MANFESKVRTNYFRVRNLAAFKAWLAALDLALTTNPKNSEQVGFLSYEPLPSSICDEETGEEEYIDVIEDLAQHLQDDQVAIVTGIGWEAMHYLVGWSIAINARGDRRDIRTDTIMHLVADLLPPGTPSTAVTAPEY